MGAAASTAPMLTRPLRTCFSNLNIHFQVMSNVVVQEIRNDAPTNIMLLDTTTLISILVMVVFIIKLFNNVLKTNSVGSLPTVGRSHLQKRSAKFHHKYYTRKPPSSHFSRRIFIPPNKRQPSRYKNLLWRFLRFRT